VRRPLMMALTTAWIDPDAIIIAAAIEAGDMARSLRAGAPQNKGGPLT